MNKSSYLPIPELKVEEAVQICWSVVDSASSYILERRLEGEDGIFTDTFDVIFEGEYPFVNFSHGGLNWNDIAVKTLSWLEWAGEGLTWLQLAKLGIDLGYSWGEIMEFSAKWTNIAANPLTWRDIATTIQKGTEHFGYIDIIPDKVKFVEYRVKAVGPYGESGYKSTGRIPVKAKIDTEDDLTLELTTGEIEYILIKADAAYIFEDALTFSYDPTALELKGIYNYNADILSDPYSGLIEFFCTKQASEDTEWSGPVLMLKLSALKNVETQLQLR